ncbi:xanthine dehydrogenase family protein molybdopterin-binding subunit [Pollutibacter soli]|uniref:xanthine dehydrogenase family protein molybdopterin-binding subunit n=1 Tax=Pollutibacter soli TaxID=3034157 RepID=UPI0030136C36
MQQLSGLGRRKFLQLAGLTGTGFFLGLNTGCKGSPEVAAVSDPGKLFEITPYINIESNGVITIFNTKPEVGQGTFQSVPALIAEELEVSLDHVNIRQTGGESRFGESQGVGGSSSVRGEYFTLRKVGATAREMLTTAAAVQWKVPVEECYAENAFIIHKPSGKKLSYGELADAASKLTPPKEPKLKDPKDFKILGKSGGRPDVPLKSSGKALFGIDVTVPGMMYASIERSPVIGSKLKKFDDAEARKTKGVIDVLLCERLVGIWRHDGVAVIADNYWAALQGRKKLKADWDHQGREKLNSKDYEAGLRKLASKKGITDHNSGSFEQEYNNAHQKLEALYETPLVSHSPIEPMNCVARWNSPEEVEIWTSTQIPGDLVKTVAKENNIPEANVKLHTMFNGGGFGRRLITDYVHDVVALAKKTGKPIKAIWTREDDTKLGPFRPMTYSAMKAGFNAAGEPVALEHKVISPSIDAGLYPGFDPKKVDKTMMEATAEQKYEIPNLHTSFVYSPLEIPLLYWRAVTSTTLAFSHECFLDEMAYTAKKDPMEFRLGLAKKGTSLEKILTKLKEVSAWDEPLPAGHGRGVAQYEFFAGHCGYVVEVSKKDKGIQLEKIFAVIDMGTVVNPDTVKAQVEGAAVMALTAAIKGGITFENGQTVQSNFHDNPLVRINEMPDVSVTILADGGEVIKGAGEPGLPPFAPALCNAVFAATGTRIRRLPFDINNVG